MRIAFVLQMMLCVLFSQAQSQTMIDYYAADARIIPLWNGDEPNSNGLDYGQPSELPAGNYAPNLYLFLPNSQSTKAPMRTILLCPGGGYGAVSLFREGLMWKHFFRSENIAMAVVSYRIPCGNAQVPLSDVYRALTILHANALQWNLNPNDIGIMGFSAGGHLAATVALNAPAEIKPAFQVLFYPVITMDRSFTHQQTRDNFLGPDPTDAMVEKYSAELNVTANAPRAFIATGSRDNVVPVLNSATYVQALSAAGVPAEIHTWPTEVHGFAIECCMPWEANALLELRDWLRSF